MSNRPKNIANSVGQRQGRPRDFEKLSASFNTYADAVVLSDSILDPITKQAIRFKPTGNVQLELKQAQNLSYVMEMIEKDNKYLEAGRGILQAQAEQEARDARYEQLPWLSGIQLNVEAPVAPPPVLKVDTSLKAKVSPPPDSGVSMTSPFEDIDRTPTPIRRFPRRI